MEEDDWAVITRKNKHCLFNTGISSSSAIPPPISPISTVLAKADSAASNHYFPLRDAFVLNELNDDPFGPTVILPDTSNLTATKKGQLPIKNLSSKASSTAVFKHLHSPLISLGQLCDDDCEINLDKHRIKVRKNNKIILQGTRSKSGDGLWDIPIPVQQNKNFTSAPSVPIQSMNIILRHDKKATDLASYLHGSLFSPTVPTLLQAIKSNFLISFPGLTTKLIKKHLPPSVFTAAGHMRQEQQGLRSTKNNSTNPSTPLPSDAPNIKTNDVICSLVSSTDKAFMDLTGRFPFRSSRGNEYILIAFHVDSNAILGEPVPNRQAATLTNTWKKLQSNLIRHGQQPNLWILDNETSNELKSAMEKYNTTYQLVPPHNHRSNAAERAIQTFKNHFKAGLASLDPDFPMNEWDRLLHQAFLTLNLLRPSRFNPKLSAHAYLYGHFDFSATPIAPPGTKVMVHNKPSNRASWDPNGKLGWYVGPSPQHYRCMKCFIPSTRKEINTDTLVFFPKQINFPSITADDFIQQATTDIITLLTHPPSATVPSLTVGDSTKNALLQIASILNRNPLKDSTMQQQTRITTAAAAALQQKISTSSIPKKQSSPSTASSSPSSFAQALQQLTRVIKTRKESSPKLRQSKLYPSPLQSFKTQAAHYLKSQEYFRHSFQHSTMHHIYDSNGKKQSLDQLLQGPDKEVWIKSTSNEFGRLTQGNIHGVTYQDAMDFIPKSDVPQNRDVTYASFVCDYRPLKSDPYRVRLVVGGDKLTYDDDAGSPAASLLETKLLINSVISTPGAKFMSMDLKDHFLCTPMLNPEYMKIPYKYFPQDIKEQYNLDKLVHKGFVYCKIKKGMYGLKQASLLAYNYLVSKLAPHGYRPIPHTIGLWKHDSKPISFCLCVDDFGVKYVNKDDVNHLLSALKQTFKVSTDWEGRNFCGLTFDWNYSKGFVDVSMPNYVQEVLHKFQHNKPPRPQRTPYNIQPQRPFRPGQRQYAPTPDSTPTLDDKGKKRIQSIVGSLLYYARAIDNTLLPALNTISAQQSKPTEATKSRCKTLLDYVATYPNVFIRYHASDMVLTIDSDAAYLVEPKARSRIAGYFQLNSSKRSNKFVNGAILIECKTLRHVVASSAEAETAGLFHNSQIALPIRYMLQQLNHKQPRTPMKTDNLMSNNFIHNNIAQRKSKSWDMRLYWLRDKENQEIFDYYWDKSENNTADYHTKHHTAKYHTEVRPRYVHDRTPQS